MIKVGINQQHFAPMVIRDDNFTPISGITMDISQAIINQAGYVVKHLPIPRKRIESFLVSGKIDAQCNTNPAWYPHKDIVWSKPLYTDQDIIISNKAIERLEDIASLKAF